MFQHNKGTNFNSKKTPSKNISSVVNLALPKTYTTYESADISRQISANNSSIGSNQASMNTFRTSMKGRYSADNIQDSPYSSNHAYRFHQKPSTYKASSSSHEHVAQNVSWKTENYVKSTSKQVFTPGDRVVFAESANAPGIPIIYRLEEERQNNPDKLNLDRRKLSVCPILEGEENLHLLNFQHNYIRKIEHMSMLRKLIFLDLYDNCVEEISGLNSLKALRVLMLGKNKIQKIANLQDLIMLDVLDLHGNRISKIENLSHLHQLRVLNLAGNEIKYVNNISTLASLTEMNLRRNNIHTVEEVDQLQNLQRLFLSLNEIKSFESIESVARCRALVEVSMDGNPIHSISSYKQFMLHNINTLRLLDMKRVTEEEKRIASVMSRKEEEKKRETDRLNTIKEKRKLAITNAQRQWNMQLQDFTDANNSESNSYRSQSISPSSPRAIDEEFSIGKRSASKDYSICHLAELDHGVLNLYGSGSLDALDKNWGDKTAESVSTVTFQYIKFCEIVPYLSRLNARFPLLEKLDFDATNICSFNDINALSDLEKLDQLVIRSQGNPVTKLKLWRSYAIFRLTDTLNLSMLNNEMISMDERIESMERFSTLSNLTGSLSETRLTMLNAKHRWKQTKVDDSCLLYQTNGKKEKRDMAARKSFASNYMREIVQVAIMTERKQTTFDELWPHFLKEFLEKSLQDMSNVDGFCCASLEKIKKSVGMT